MAIWIEWEYNKTEPNTWAKKPTDNKKQQQQPATEQEEKETFSNKY